MKEQAARLLETLKSYRNILILVKGSPDPDAIASSFAIKEICDFLGVEASIISRQKLSLPQNRLFVKKLDIPLKITSEPVKSEKFDAYVILDHQSVNAEGITGNIPCAVHIDHHEKVEEEIPVGFRSVRDDVGSTSTIIALLIREMDIKLKQTQAVDISTALLYGIQTDTDKYQHATNLDYEAINYLSGRADRRIINKIAGLPISEKTAQYLERAVKNQMLYKDWLIAGIEYVNESDRDSIAIIADFILKRKKASVAVVFAAITGKKNPKLVLDASLRTNNENLDLNAIIKNITSSGGARKFKGAFQIDLSYLDHCQDRKALWDVINSATIEAIKEQRDKKPASDIKGAFIKFSSKMSRIFR